MASFELKQKITTAALVAVAMFLVSILACNLAGGFFFHSEATLVFDNIFLKPVKNFGFVFSIPLDLKIVYAITVFVLAIIGWIFFKYLISEAYIFSAAYGLIMGGAVANFYERVTDGFVWDYLNVQIFGLNGAWNIADIAIIFGVIIWFFALALQYYASHMN